MDGIVMRVYGIGPDDGEKEVECPHCNGTDTEFLGYADEARNTEKYICHECKAEFEAEIEIPF